jgi:hypothetical protein
VAKTWLNEAVKKTICLKNAFLWHPWSSYQGNEFSRLFWKNYKIFSKKGKGPWPWRTNPTILSENRLKDLSLPRKIFWTTVQRNHIRKANKTEINYIFEKFFLVLQHVENIGDKLIQPVHADPSKKTKKT